MTLSDTRRGADETENRFAQPLFPSKEYGKGRKMKTVEIYTDGACRGNPGPGGWAAILVWGQREKELSDRLMALESERTLLIRSIESTEKLISVHSELTLERAALCDRLTAAEGKLDVITKTQQLLIETSNSMAKEQLGATNRKFKTYLDTIDPLYTNDTNLNISFEATRQEMGTTHIAEAYSKGTRDLFELSTKLAISDSMFGSAKPFIILDDPFVYLDDKRLESAKRLLYTLSKERQILYFTASKFRGM